MVTWKRSEWNAPRRYVIDVLEGIEAGGWENHNGTQIPASAGRSAIRDLAEVPHLRAEIARLTAALEAERENVDDLKRQRDLAQPHWDRLTGKLARALDHAEETESRLYREMANTEAERARVETLRRQLRETAATAREYRALEEERCGYRPGKAIRRALADPLDTAPDGGEGVL